MSNIKDCKQMMERYLKARIPFIAINSIERGRVLDILKEVSTELSLPILVHTLSKGLVEISTDRVVSEDKSVYSAIDYMSEQMVMRQNLTILFTEIPDISSDTSDAKQFKDLITLANESGGTIMVLTNTPVWSQLQRLGLIIKLDLPDEDEMHTILSRYIDSYRSLIPVEWDETEIGRAHV